MSRRILTADDVAKLPADQPLVVDELTTLTDSARDMVRRRGLEIVETLRPEAAGEEPGVLTGGDVAPGIASSNPAAVPAGRPGRLIIVAVGTNRPGIMAELGAAVGELGGDIQDLSQRITGGYFHAILIVDISKSGHSFAEYRDKLKVHSEPADYIVTVVDERVFRAMHRL